MKFLILLTFLFLLGSDAHAQAPPTCAPVAAPQNLHVLTWMNGPAVFTLWCYGPNSTLNWWSAKLDPAVPPAACTSLWKCLTPTTADDQTAVNLLNQRWLPRLLITKGSQPVMQVSATGVATPLLINGVAQTVTRDGTVGNQCRGPAWYLKTPGETLYSTLGLTSDQGQTLPGPASTVTAGITAPATGLIWCYLTYPPAHGWTN